MLLQQGCPWARPPRRLMQELNEYFMTSGEHSWATLRSRLAAAVVAEDETPRRVCRFDSGGGPDRG